MAPTIKQKRAFDNLVEVGRNGGSKKTALIKAGYSVETAKAPTKVTESVGFKTLCEERGLTETFLVDALVNDIKKKPKNRKSELELGFKVIGKLSEKEQKPNVNIVFLPMELMKKYDIAQSPEPNSIRQS